MKIDTNTSMTLRHSDTQTLRHSDTQYRPDIDGLRAIAILAVVAFHAGVPSLSGGFVGVDIFFVLSGFLITSTLFKEAEQTGGIDLSEFYARRVRRLLPAATLVLVVTVFLAYFFLMPVGDEQLKFARSAFAAALFASNFYFWTSSGGYFDGPSDQISLLHTWSLSVEEQFYLIWPILLIGIVRFSNWRSLKLLNMVLGALTLMFIGSLATSVWLSAVSPSAGFYLLPARVWELAAGAITGVLLQKEWLQDSLKIKFNMRWLTVLLALLGLIAICFSIVYFDARMAFPGWVALLPVVGTVAVLVAGAIDAKNLLSRVLSIKPMVFIGKLSYSWYLWHWPLLAFVKIDNFGHSDLYVNLLVVLVALVLAFLTYHFVENPIRHKKPYGFQNRSGSLKLGCGMIAIGIAAAAVLLALRIQAQETVLSKAVDFAYTDFSPLRFTCSRDGSKPLETLDKAECETGNMNVVETIVVWGDSHSDHWMPLIVEYFKDYRIIQYSMPGCAPLIGNSHPFLENCRGFNDLVLKSIQQNPNVKGVILSARWAAFAGSSAIQNKNKNDVPPYFDITAKSAQDSLNIFRSSFEKTTDLFRQDDFKILVLAPTPEFQYPVPVCLLRKALESCQSTRAENDIYRGAILKILREVTEKIVNVKLADGYDALCKTEFCQVTQNGRVLYSDGDHLTGSGAKAALASMTKEFEWFAQK